MRAMECTARNIAIYDYVPYGVVTHPAGDGLRYYD